MKHKTYLVVLVLTAVMTGCLKVQKKDEVAATTAKKKMVVPQQNTNREMHIDDVFVDYIGQNQPDLYDIVFSWPATRDRLRLTVNGQVLVTTNTQEVLQHELSNVQGGRKLSVLIEVLNQQNHIISSKTRDLEIPKDYVFPKNFRLTNDMTITNDRVFMNGSVITTQNFKLNIKTKKIIILEKSYVQNFEMNEKAQPALHGRNGGEIRIEALVAEGELNVTMNSEAGGNGFKGLANIECPPSIGQGMCFSHFNCPAGGSGMNAGINGNLFVRIDKVDNFKIYPQYTLSEGGQPGPGANANTPDGYPVFVNYKNNHLSQCPKIPIKGTGAQPGKICLTYSGQNPEQGCE